MQAVPEVYKEAQDRFERIFGRRPSDPVSGYRHEDALILLVASSTMASTAKTVVDGRRKRGEKVGLIKIKMFRPFPAADVLSLMGSANRIAILDRNFALGAGPGAGGIFCQEVLAAMGQSNHQAFVQGYTLGLGGMDVTPTLLDEIVDDIQALKAPGKTIWKGL